MSNLAIEAAFSSPTKGTRYRFKNVLRRAEDRVGEGLDVQRLSLSSAGYLYERGGDTDRQQASDATEQRSLRVAPDQLVVNPMWLTGGSIAISDMFGAVSPDYRVFTPRHDLTYPRFLHHLLRSQPYRDQYNLFVRANTTFDRRIQQGDLDQLPLWLPARQEQRRIADFLDDRVAHIDRITAARQEQVEGLAHARQAVVEAALDRLPDRTRASRLVRVLPGFAFQSPDYSPDSTDVRLLRGVNVKVGSLRWDDVAYWPQAKLTGLEAFRLKVGDVVMGMDRPWIGAGLRIAQVGPQDERPLLLQRVAKIWSENLESRFVFWAFRSQRFQSQVECDLTGLSVPHLSAEQILSYQMPVGPPRQLREVTTELDDFERYVCDTTAQLLRSVDLLNEYKRSLITAAVTGELDVATAGTGIPG